MKLWDLRKMVDRQHAQPPVKKYVWDYRGMSYPGQPGVDKYVISHAASPCAHDCALPCACSKQRSWLCRHPHDLSVSTFQGHSVLRTLIRCRFTPSAWSGAWSLQHLLASRSIAQGLTSTDGGGGLQTSAMRVRRRRTVRCIYTTCPPRSWSVFIAPRKTRMPQLVHVRSSSSSSSLA
jgi:hypothetical protein